MKIQHLRLWNFLIVTYNLEDNNTRPYLERKGILKQTLINIENQLMPNVKVAL
jgi:hypothetical protein